MKTSKSPAAAARARPHAKRSTAPPALFVGRARDVARAKEALARRRVLVVWGLGGLGKSALLRALIDRGSRHKAVEIHASAGLGLAEVAQIARAMWGASPSPSKDPQAQAASIVDLADEREATLVVDDAHHMAPGACATLLRAFAGYATRATLLVSARERPDVPDLAEQLLQLGPLDMASTEDLVRSCRPEMSHEERATIVARSAGSPWLARCLATSGEVEGAAGITADLDAPTRLALAVLRWIDEPVPVAFIDRLARRPGLCAALVSRAFVERVGDDVRLHDVARELFAAALPLDEDAARLALPRAELELAPTGPRGACVALALAAASDEAEAIARLVAEHGAGILERGFGASAWRALARLPADRATHFRLACAAHGATREAVDWAAGIERPRDPAAAVWWAQCLDAGGRGREARTALTETAAGSELGPALAAAILLARMTRTPDDALQVLRALRRRGLAEAGPAGLAAALQARSLTYLDRVDEALRMASLALEEMERSPDWSREAARLLFSLLVNVGRCVDAGALLRRLLADSAESELSTRQLAVAALYAVKIGDLPSARRRVERLARCHGHDAANSRVAFLRFRLAYLEGDEEAASKALRALTRAAGATRNAEAVLWTRIATLQLALWTAGSAPPWTWPPGVGRGSGPHTMTLEIHERMARAAHGAEVNCDDLHPPEGALDVVLFHAQLAATCRERAGDGPGAVAVLGDALAMARQQNSVVMELELLGQLGRLHFAAGALEPAAKIGREQLAVATELGLSRFVRSGRDLAACGAGHRNVRHGLLELDLETRALRFVDGRLVSLAGHEVGLRILEALMRSGGRATKAELARTVWDRRSYDPRRDDKRMQMAVRRLRLLLEREPARPHLVVTTADGYALAE